jgi:hypothetical protein
VVLVVELHDLAGDGGLERAIVIYSYSVTTGLIRQICVDVHGRSGRVAFPRTKVVPASPARETVGAVALAAERRAVVRRRVEFMLLAIDGSLSIELQAEL